MRMTGSLPSVVSDTITKRVLVQVETAVSEGHARWRFSDGAIAFYADVEDPILANKLDSRAERFERGDLLVVDLRRIQTVLGNCLSMQHSITRVYERQAQLQRQHLR